MCKCALLRNILPTSRVPVKGISLYASGELESHRSKAFGGSGSAPESKSSLRVLGDRHEGGKGRRCRFRGGHYRTKIKASTSGYFLKLVKKIQKKFASDIGKKYLDTVDLVV